MTDFRKDARTVAGEVLSTLERIDDTAIEKALDLIDGAGKIFVIGVGREGLASRALAMRLAHCGLRVHVGWDDTTPAVGPKDLMIMVNGSGRIGHLDYVFGRVREAGAKTIVVTGVPDAPTPRAATLALQVPATVYLGEGDLVGSIQPMGSLFEQCLLIVFDLLVLQFSRRRGLTFAELSANHRNFE